MPLAEPDHDEDNEETDAEDADDGGGKNDEEKVEVQGQVQGDRVLGGQRPLTTSCLLHLYRTLFIHWHFSYPAHFLDNKN